MNKASFYLCVVMYCLLSVPMFFMLVDIADGPDSIHEERVAVTPTLGSVKKFVTDFRFYISERYGLKQKFISWYSWASQALFNKSPYPDVLIGENDYLFLADDEALKSYQRSHPFTEAQLSQWVTAISEVKAHFEGLGIEYRLAIAPNKHTVYGDYLPEWLKVGAAESRAAALLKQSEAHRLGLIDLRAPLQQARDNGEDVFYKTDTHWNEYGASFASRTVALHLGEHLPAMPSVKPYIADKAGDLARMIGQQNALIEAGFTLADYPSLACEYSNGATYQRNQTDPIFPTPQTVSCRNAEPRSASVVVFMDSFGVSMLPSLAHHFSNSFFVWQYSVDASLVKRLAPKYVVQIIVERKLETLAPSALTEMLITHAQDVASKAAN